MFDKFADRHIGTSSNSKDLKEMLDVIGVKSVEELISQVIPQSIRLKKPLDLPKEGMSEYEFAAHIRGNTLLDASGKPRMYEVFNFGKYKGWGVADVLHKDPGYYSWMLSSDFTFNTKQVLTRIRLREFNNR